MGPQRFTRSPVRSQAMLMSERTTCTCTRAVAIKTATLIVECLGTGEEEEGKVEEACVLLDQRISRLPAKN